MTRNTENECTLKDLEEKFYVCETQSAMVKKKKKGKEEKRTDSYNDPLNTTLE